MDKIVRKGLEKLMMWIAQDNIIHSWRFYCENNIILSIKFKSIPGISDSSDQPSISQHQQKQATVQYRSKPPCAISRDSSRRQQYWGNQIAMKNDNNKHDKGDVVTDMTGNREESHRDVCGGDLNKTVYIDDIPNSLPTDSGCIDVLAQWSPYGPIQSTPISNDYDGPDREHCESVMVEAESQTVPLSSSTGTQTDTLVTKVQCSGTQHPAVKKKYAQTYKHSTQDADVQTEKLQSKDTFSYCEQQSVMSSAHTMTETVMFNNDKCVATDPPVNRHIQTFPAKSSNKKVGPSMSDSCVQVHLVRRVHCDTQTPNESYLNTPYVQSAEDYLFQKQQQIHDLHSEMVVFVTERSTLVQQLIQDFQDVLDGINVNEGVT